jgi:hypothetical protein
MVCISSHLSSRTHASISTGVDSLPSSIVYKRCHVLPSLIAYPRYPWIKRVRLLVQFSWFACLQQSVARRSASQECWALYESFIGSSLTLLSTYPCRALCLCRLLSLYMIPSIHPEIHMSSQQFSTRSARDKELMKWRPAQA